MPRETVHIPHPVVTANGEPTHVMVPIDQYLDLFGEDVSPPSGWTFVPSGVSDKVIEGVSPLRAWREHCRLTQEEVARRMGVSRPAYTQMEQSGKPHRDTLEKAARAFEITLAQLVELYDDEPVTVPKGVDPA